MSVKKAEHDGVHLHSWCAIQAPSGRFQGSLASQISRIDELKVNLGLYIPIPTPPQHTHTNIQIHKQQKIPKNKNKVLGMIFISKLPVL